MATTVERKATIFAVGELRQFQNKGEAKSLLFAEKKRYTGGYKGQSPHRGIKVEEESKFPQLASTLGVSPTSDLWYDKVNNFWAEFMYHIPFGEINSSGKVDGGIKIDAGWRVLDNGQIIANDFNSYVTYEMMMNDKKVCSDPEDFSSASRYTFFCVDEAVEAEKSKVLSEVYEKAIIEFSKLVVEHPGQADTLPKLRQIAAFVDSDLTSLRAKVLDRSEAIHVIRNVVNKNPQKLLEAVEDKSLGVKAFIGQAVEAGAIIRNGSTYLYNGEQIGDEEQMVNFLRNKDNDREKKTIQVRIDEFTSIGIA